MLKHIVKPGKRELVNVVRIDSVKAGALGGVVMGWRGLEEVTMRNNNVDMEQRALKGKKVNVAQILILAEMENMDRIGALDLDPAATGKRRNCFDAC